VLALTLVMDALKDVLDPKGHCPPSRRAGASRPIFSGMSLDPGLQRRRSTRLRARDYSSPGHYFVTLCVHERELLFGDVIDGVMHLNDACRAAESFWREIPLHFPHAVLDEFQVMPNHVHAIVRIVDGLWVHMDAPTRAIGTWGAGVDVLNVGANNHLPLQQRHMPIHPLTRSKLFPMGHGTSRTIGSIVRGFKIAVTRRMRSAGRRDPVWQRNYHDHIIRNDRSLERICKYIRNNPANWGRDRNNPDRKA